MLNETCGRLHNVTWENPHSLFDCITYAYVVHSFPHLCSVVTITHSGYDANGQYTPSLLCNYVVSVMCEPTSQGSPHLQDGSRLTFSWPFSFFHLLPSPVHPTRFSLSLPWLPCHFRCCHEQQQQQLYAINVRFNLKMMQDKRNN